MFLNVAVFCVLCGALASNMDTLLYRVWVPAFHLTNHLHLLLEEFLGNVGNCKTRQLNEDLRHQSTFVKHKK